MKKLLHPLLGSDTKRTLIVAVVVAAMLALAWALPLLTGEPAFSPWLASGAAVTLMLIYSHIGRRILFPYIDLAKFADEAIKTPLSAAIVLAAVAWVLGKVLEVHGLMLR